MKLESYFNGTVNTGTPVTLEIVPDTPSKSKPPSEDSYRITATGAGSLKIETKAVGMAAFNVEANIIAKSVILDFSQLQEMKLTASGSNVPVTVAPYFRA